MKYFLRICTCLACLYMLALSQAHAQAPVIDQMTLFGSGGAVAATSSPTGIATNTTVLLRFDQQIFDSSGSPFTITNITNAFTATAPFSAIINGTGRFVTITFTTELAANTIYTVTLGAGTCRNSAAELCAAQSINFTTSAPVTTSMPTLDICANGVYAALGNIVITEASATSFGQGNNQIFEINAPAGFEFDTNVGYGISSMGADVFSLSIVISINKIIVIYSVGTSYFGIDAITISGVGIRKLTGIATGTLLRTGGNAIQAGNRAIDASRPTLATINSLAVPSAPTLPATFVSSNLAICSGFSITDATSFTIAGGTSAYFYDATNTLIHTTTTAGVSRQDLGYTGANNTILGTKQFYVTTRNNTAPFCESIKVPFTITINPNPVVNLTLTTGTTTICLPNQSVFTAVGTVGATYTFLWNGSAATAAANGTLSTTNTLNDTYTTNISGIASGALSVRATVAGNCNTISPATNLVVNTTPVIDFIWITETSYPNNVASVPLRDGSTFGGYVGTFPVGTFNPAGTGVYSGTAVVGTTFYPSLAPLNLPITITYTYTDVNGCVGSSTIQFTVYNANNPIANLIPLYCASAPSAAVLTPSLSILNDSPIPSPLSALPPNAPFMNGVIYDISPTYPTIFTFDVGRYFFPSGLPGNINAGIVWDSVLNRYTFDASLVLPLIPVGDEFIIIPIRIAVFRTNLQFLIPAVNYVTRCNFVSAFVRVYKNPILNVNLANLTEFCPATPALTVLPKVSLGNPLVVSNPPSGSTFSLEYYLTSNPASIATLPSDIINPALIPAGNYTLRYTYTSPQSCGPVVLERTFIIKTAISPTLQIRNQASSIISTACVGDASIKIFTSIVGTATISKVAGATTTAGLVIGETTFSIVGGNFSGAGVYNITITIPTTGTNCGGTSSVSTLTIYDNPLPTFTFSGANTLAICYNATSFVVSPGAGLPLGAGQVFVRKTTGGAIGQLFPIGVININPLVDFNTNSGLGAGIYDISYVYTTNTGACVGTSLSKQLTINPAPSLGFSLNTYEICNKTIRDNVILTPNWSNAVAPNVLNIANGNIKIYAALTGGSFLNQFIGTNTIITNSISISNPTIVNDFYVEYEYTDNNSCTGVSIRQKLSINPLPILSINFTNTVPPLFNEFCHGDGNFANFTVSASGVNVLPFDPLKGRISLRANTTSSPVTPTFTTNLPAGSNSFNPSVLLNISQVGEYFIDYIYEDSKGCFNTVTCPDLLKLKFYTAPQFLFPVTPVFALGSNTFEVCANVTTLTLSPSLINTTSYGTDNPLLSSRGVYTFTKGAFTATVNGTDTFNPKTLLVDAVGGGVGTYNIKYTYTSARGCVGESLVKELTINSLPTLDFSFAGTFVGTPTFCADATSFNLLPIVNTGAVPIPVNGFFTIRKLLPAVGAPFNIAPSVNNIDVTAIQFTGVGTYEVFYNYTDVNGCPSISLSQTFIINALPVTTISFVADNKFCADELANTPLVTLAYVSGAGAFTLANSTFTIKKSPFIRIIPAIQGINMFNPSELASLATGGGLGAYTIEHTYIDANGCSKTTAPLTFNVGAVPVANFTTALFCQGTATTFTSNSTVSNDIISNYSWDFGDGNTSPTNATSTTTHVYSTSGRYIAKLTVRTSTLCENTIEKEVFIFPRITPTAAAPYKDNFDGADNNTWFTTGLIKANLNPLQDTTATSWKRGVPTGAKINATTTAGGAWSTSGNLNSFYPNERSYVESPCFNFTDPTLTKPIISMKIWYDTDRGSDAAVLYSSINDGASWQVVGNINDGIEWYNTAGIISQPGGQNVPQAWSGDLFTQFKVAKFNLDQFKGLPSVRFRVAFGSNADNVRVFDGFAFDEVFIGNRNRIALLEHFTNASSSEANTENTFINNFPTPTAQNEIYNIQYHTNVPGADPMNADNTAVPSARALFYGVSQVPRTAIDGVIENRKFSEWGVPVYNKRTLETSPFELSVDFSSTAQQLRFKANVRALEPFTRRVILQTVVIEQEILGTAFTGGNFGGLTFKNIVKGMIPNASGTLIAQTWLQNTQFQTGELVWANVPKIYNGNRLVLVIFVQDEVTREIYQTGFFNITTNIVQQDPTTALDNTTLENEFVVYPNPAQNEVFTGFRDEIAEDFSVVLFDSYGKKVDDFSLTKGNKGLLINTEKYASGMYFVEITGKNNSKARRKLVIAR